MVVAFGRVTYISADCGNQRHGIQRHGIGRSGTKAAFLTKA